jgi:anti-sigma-K factor RskA
MQPNPRSERLDRLSADYALGTMPRGARRRFETWIARDLDVARAAARWHQRLLPLVLRLKPVSPPPSLWTRIEAQLFTPPQRVAAAAGGGERGDLTRRGWLRWLAPLPAGMLAAGLTMGLVGPALWRAGAGGGEAEGEPAAGGPQLPQSYVGVLATAAGKSGLIVSSLRQGRVVDLKRLGPAPTAPGGAAAGRVLVLWWIGADGVPQAVAQVPDAPFASVTLPASSEQVFGRAVELAVSHEVPGFAVAPAAGTALPAPTLPFVYRGLCGKLWPPPAQPASAARR